MKIVVVGFGVASLRNGKLCTRPAVAQYLKGLSYFGEVSWFTQTEFPSEDLTHPVPRGTQVNSIKPRNVLANTRSMLGFSSDAIYIVSFPALLMVWPFFLSKKRKNIALYIGNDISSKPVDFYRFVVFMKWIRRNLITRICALKARVIFARGKVLTKRFETINSNVIETLPITLQFSGSDPTKLPISVGKSPYVLFVGKLQKEKGINLLLDTYLNEKHGNNLPNLVIVGQGPEQQAVLHATHKNSKVISLGYVSSGDVLAALYSKASAILLPSLSEGLPRVFSEAIAFHVPIYSTPLPTIVGEYGEHVNYFTQTPPDTAEIHEVLNSLSTRKTFESGYIEGADAAAKQHIRTMLDIVANDPPINSEQKTK